MVEVRLRFETLDGLKTQTRGPGSTLLEVGATAVIAASLAPMPLKVHCSQQARTLSSGGEDLSAIKWRQNSITEGQIGRRAPPEV
ncbi:hypothetical protein TgHK011_008944 [Trichoderma gracile]|nr:hypothetical protein TgHK011_008944 [Trichoderma gracile]